MLEAQAGATNIDLVIKGKLNGHRRGFLYRPASNDYRLDRAAAATVTQSELRSLLTADDTLTLMGVPPGSGARIGIDRDQNSILDGDTIVPRLLVSASSLTISVSWPTVVTGFILEQSTSLAENAWTPVDANPAMDGDLSTVTLPLSGTKTFLRLREL